MVGRTDGHGRAMYNSEKEQKLMRHKEEQAIVKIDLAVEVLRQAVRNYYNGKISRNDFIILWTTGTGRINESFEAFREEFGS